MYLGILSNLRVIFHKSCNPRKSQFSKNHCSASRLLLGTFEQMVKLAAVVELAHDPGPQLLDLRLPPLPHDPRALRKLVHLLKVGVVHQDQLAALGRLALSARPGSTSRQALHPLGNATVDQLWGGNLCEF